MTSVFGSKLDRLGETIALVAEADHRSLTTALRACSARPVLAVGSGGSIIVAEFLAACRIGLGHSFTVVATPMGYVLEAASAPGAHIWLFSASGENEDILAAFDAATADHGAGLDVVTSNSTGALAAAAIAAAAWRRPVPSVHLTPVADIKDGFLATHSVISAAASLVFAADELVSALPRSMRRAQLLDVAARHLATRARADLRFRQLERLVGRDTLLLLHDPHLAAAAVLIETSFWEAGICAVQRTDFRNFAHGRHVWLARHPARTFVLALTCERSRAVWAGIRHELPQQVPSAHLDFGRAGRGALFEAILSALTVIEAASGMNSVDPGRPGVAEFGRRIFKRHDLRAAMSADDAPTRLKRRAATRVDLPGRESTDWPGCRDRFAAELADAEIRAVVLDYDGTVVATPERLKPPRADILCELVELADHGVVVGFATGRGGSVGEMLRAHIPERLHSGILVGYYNGAHVVSLEVDIAKRPPDPDEAIAAIHARLCAEAGLFVDGWLPKKGPLQITVPLERLSAPELQVERIAGLVNRSASDSAKPGMARIMRSGHSVDVVPAWASKMRVVEQARHLLDDTSAAVLRIGDSGDCQGNDYELLGGSLGLSVDRVCHRDGSCWNLLPPGVSGPDGLARILSVLRPLRRGVVHVDVSALFAI